MRRRWLRETAALALLTLALGTATPGEAQRRRLRKIDPPKPAEVEGEVVEGLVPPTATACETAARRIAAAYGSDGLRGLLHEDFPNRDEVLDALSRSGLRVSRLELGVESVGALEIEPWRLAGDGIAISDCHLDVRTLLSFDDLETGERQAVPGRHRWRIRFTRVLASPPGGEPS